MATTTRGGHDVTLEQGRGSATTRSFCHSALRYRPISTSTNGRPIDRKGGALTGRRLYQAQDRAAFIAYRQGQRSRTRNSAENSRFAHARGSERAQLRIFTAPTAMKGPTSMSSLSMTNAKTTALFGATIDVVRCDSPSLRCYFRRRPARSRGLHLAGCRRARCLGLRALPSTTPIAPRPEFVRNLRQPPPARLHRGLHSTGGRRAILIHAQVAYLAGTLDAASLQPGLLALSTPARRPRLGPQSTRMDDTGSRTLKAGRRAALAHDKPVASFSPTTTCPK